MAEQSRDANVPDRQGALIASKAPGSNQDAADFRADGAAKAEYQKRSFRANLLDRIQPDPKPHRTRTSSGHVKETKVAWP